MEGLKLKSLIAYVSICFIIASAVFLEAQFPEELEVFVLVTFFVCFLFLLYFIDKCSDYKKVISNLKDEIRSIKNREVEAFCEKHPEWLVSRPFGNHSYDFDGYVQYKKGRKKYMQLTSWEWLQPMSSSHKEVNARSVKDRLHEHGISFKARNYIPGRGFSDLLQDDSVPYEETPTPKSLLDQASQG
jgi:hypothetical protein